jgi:hypothetical protein
MARLNVPLISYSELSLPVMEFAALLVSAGDLEERPPLIRNTAQLMNELSSAAKMIGLG